MNEESIKVEPTFPYFSVERSLGADIQGIQAFPVHPANYWQIRYILYFYIMNFFGWKQDESLELASWRKKVRALGMPLVPDGMLAGTSYGASLLGSGSHGVCHRITVYRDSRCVTAVTKVMHEDRFGHGILREATMYQHLQGIKGVPSLLGVSIRPPALVLTYHGPHTLLEVLRQAQPRATTLQLLQAMEQVVATLRNIHSLKLVHNDIKVNNILLTFLEEGGVEATVIDLGSMTRAGCSPYHGMNLKCAQFPFLAPELVQGGPASPASDVYSLGRVLQMVGHVAGSQDLLQVGRLCLAASVDRRPTLQYVQHKLQHHINFHH